MISETLRSKPVKTGASLFVKFKEVRSHSETLCKPLLTEDYVVQPTSEVSPPKWHLGHTTWFFETMVLKPFLKGYVEFHPQYNFIFNSYYETVGARIIRTDRGNLSRPTVKEIYKYRKYVDDAMETLLQFELTSEQKNIITTGLNHEQQHQELLLSDIKYILGNNPLLPPYNPSFTAEVHHNNKGYTKINKGLYEIGYKGTGFCYDNELQAHSVYLND